jgi:hypothetical protein
MNAQVGGRSLRRIAPLFTAFCAAIELRLRGITAQKRGQFLILIHEAPIALSRHGPQVERRVRSDRGRSSEGGFGGALAGGDDDDGWVDRRASGNEHERLSEHHFYRRKRLGE